MVHRASTAVCPFTGTNHLQGTGTACSTLNSHSRKQGLYRDESLWCLSDSLGFFSASRETYSSERGNLL